jgi:hypothetical protein
MAIPSPETGAVKILSCMGKTHFSKKKFDCLPQRLGRQPVLRRALQNSHSLQKASPTRGALSGFAKASERSRPIWQNRVT